MKLNRNRLSGCPQRRTPRIPLALALACGAGASPIAVHAGGLEFPANGTEALGRGGAFTAKADTPLAMEYNVAGLAEQRGTRLLFDNNLFFGNFSFQRSDMLPSGGSYGLVSDQASKPFYAPWFGLTTDFGFFDRWTFAIGAYGPSSVGNRSYVDASGNPLGNGAARYDATALNSLIIFPTLAAAVRITRAVDLGVSLQDAIAQVDLSNVSYAPQPFCMPDKTPNKTGCDAGTRVQASNAFNPILQLGALVHLPGGFDVGFHTRSASNLGASHIAATGTLTASSALVGGNLPPKPATFDLDIPWLFRLGVRYAHRHGGREVFDVELDGTYELWSANHGSDSLLTAVPPIRFDPSVTMLNATIAHNYKDTYSVRLGGAYNWLVRRVEVTGRLGFYYDSSATNSADTRIDFNTLDKLAGTVGLGIRYRGVQLNAAFAYIQSLDRTVADGRLSPIDGTNGSAATEVGIVNNGTYKGSNQIVSLGLLIQFDELIKGDRWTRKPAVL